MKTTKRVLPADVFDALELSAEAFGGIGAGIYIDDVAGPVCALGHANFAEGFGWADAGGEMRDALKAAFITEETSDTAVERINERRGTYREDNVPFADWCVELGVERGA